MTTTVRFLHVTAFVGAWMGLGWALHLSPESYLTLGVPLLVLFQLFVQKQPLRKLWVRNSDRFKLGTAGMLVAGAFLALTGFMAIAILIMIFASMPEGNWRQCAFFGVACIGAVGLGFAVQHGRLVLSRRALWPFMIAVLLGMLIMALGNISEGKSAGVPLSRMPALLFSFLTYLPVCFVMEEVVFRGALDTYVWQPEGRRAEAWISAAFVSVLWGLWHLPILPDQTLPALLAAAPVVMLVHAIDGIFIAFSWRASGSLLLPAIYHSLIDAYRDALQA
jgi:membrane protease YdiL (CAAX protease family)